MRTDAMTAAYPSGHALAGFVMAEYYARKFPDVANEARELGEKIARSREVVGIHFPSDTQISREISNIIWENNLILD
jgi:acid phosphatase (class A)